MKQTINFYDFEQAFKAIRPDNFSYEGLRILYDWFESIDDDCGTETELDVVAICCEFNESTRDEILAGYSPDDLDDFSVDHEFVDWLNERTMVCGETDSTIIYGAF